MQPAALSKDRGLFKQMSKHPHLIYFETNHALSFVWTIYMAKNAASCSSGSGARKPKRQARRRPFFFGVMLDCLHRSKLYFTPVRVLIAPFSSALRTPLLLFKLWRWAAGGRPRLAVDFMPRLAFSKKNWERLSWCSVW